MCPLLRYAGHHRERWLRPCQCLDLALVVHAQNHCSLGWVQVEPDDVVDLLHEQWIGGQLEPTGAMRLEFERLPDPADRGPAQSTALGHLRSRPARGVGRQRLQRRHHHILDLIGSDARRSAGPSGAWTNRPRHWGLPSPQHTPTQDSHELVVRCDRAGQHDPGTQRHSLRRLTSSGPPLELITLLRNQLQYGRFGSSAWIPAIIATVRFIWKRVTQPFFPLVSASPVIFVDVS